MINEYLKNAQLAGLNIDVVYDIGACSGYWSLGLKSSVLPNSSFFLFEANESRSQELNMTGFPYYIGILSKPDVNYVDFYSKHSTGDSYYKENTIHYDQQTSTRLPCKTLLEVISENNLPIPNLLKIDTQGSELDILEGCSSILEEIDLIFLECPFIEYNIGSPTLQDYLNYMKGCGFIATDILEVHTAEHVILQIDIMFINIKTKNRIYGPTVYSRPLG